MRSWISVDDIRHEIRQSDEIDTKIFEKEYKSTRRKEWKFSFCLFRQIFGMKCSFSPDKKSDRNYLRQKRIMGKWNKPKILIGFERFKIWKKR